MGVSAYNEDKEFVKEFLELHPPGGYLFKETSAEEIARQYMKVDKASWHSMLIHDLFIAFLRRDEAQKGALKEAYKKLAEMFGWKEAEPWSKFEAEPLKWGRESARALFEFYRKGFRVDGWRLRVDETVADGLARRLEREISPAGDKFRTEYGRWYRMAGEGSALWGFYEEQRAKDKVALYMAGELEVLSFLYTFNKALRFSYLDLLLSEMTGEIKLEPWEEEGFWHANQGLRSYIYHVTHDLSVHECLYDLAAAAMAILDKRANVKSERDEAEKYVWWVDNVYFKEQKNYRVVKDGKTLWRWYRDAVYVRQSHSDLFCNSLLKSHSSFTERERSYWDWRRQCAENSMIMLLWFMKTEEGKARRRDVFRWEFTGKWEKEPGAYPPLRP